MQKAEQETKEKLAIAIAENEWLKAAVEKLSQENAYFKKQQVTSFFYHD
jgi:hypothetical protein